MNDSAIAIIPIEISLDKRLTLEQMRVLIALFSFRNKDTNLVWPSRGAIAERTGMHVSNISEATTGLVKLGWLTKDGKGGFSKASRYTLTTPDLEKVADQATVADSARGGVADSARGKEQPSEQPSEQPKVAAGESSPPAPRKKKSSLTPEMQESCRATWEAYAAGYGGRYAVEPVMNSKVAGQIVNFVKRVGMGDAPLIAGWFPAHNAAYYIRRGHTIDCLLTDAEKLRTEWATGRVATDTAAKQADRAQSNASAADEALRILEGGSYAGGC